jgi:uncharacterized protein YbjT (DUF2867 family)
MILGGTVALPVGDVREPFVDAEDIADVAVAALTDPSLSGRVYEVTGPRLMTFAEAVQEIARASGRDLQFIHVPHEAFLASAREAGVPARYVELLDDLFREVLDGRNQSLTSGIQDALGRAPRDFAAYADQTAATGVWTAAVASRGMRCVVSDSPAVRHP